MHDVRAHVHPFRIAQAPGASVPGGDRSGLLLVLRTGDGLEGWGEASPLPGFSAETLEEAESLLRAIAARPVRFDADDPMGVASRMVESAAGAPPALDVVTPPAHDVVTTPASVRFAVETACLNLASRIEGRPVPDLVAPLFGEAPARSGCSSATLATGPPPSWAEALDRILGHPTATLKIKLGRHGADAERAGLRALGDRLGGAGHDVRLRFDPNRAWSFDEALRFWEAAHTLPVEFVEEPLKGGDHLSELVERTGMPVALDETLRERRPERVVERCRAVAALVVKPTLMGGIVSLQPWLEAFRGVPVVVSSSYETGVGLTMLADLARSIPGPTVAAGLDTSSALGRDVIDPPFRIRDGHVVTSAGYRVAHAEPTERREPERP